MHRRAELDSDTVVQRIQRILGIHAVFEHVMQDAADDRSFVVPVARQDQGNRVHVGCVGHGSPHLPVLPVMVLPSEGQGVVDARAECDHVWGGKR